MELIWMRATGLIRRGWRATVVFAVLAGLAAGMAMALMAAGRRTATVYDRFATFADAPELLANFCPVDFVVQEDSLEDCYLYDSSAERDIIAALPEVDAVARGEFRGVSIAPADDPDDRRLASSVVMQDPGVVSPSGRYRIIDGADAVDADEIVVNEHLADVAELEIGDEVVLGFWTDDELGDFGEEASFSGPSVDARVTGIGRAVSDLAASQDAAGTADEASVVYGGPRFAEATPTAAGIGGLMIEAVDDDADAASAAIEQAFPDRPFNLVPALGEDEIQPTRDAIRYEAQAAIALGLVVAVVIAAFLVQALARQSRREWSDGAVLRAIGMSRGMAISSALLRSLGITVPAIVVAGATAVALSPFGPIGEGRAAEVDPGVQVDAMVLVVGALGLLATVTLGITAPLVRGRVMRTAPTVQRTSEPRALAVPPVLSIGLQFARFGRSGSTAEVGTALIGVGAAVAISIAAAGLTASFDDLADTPARFGAPWDVSVGSSGTTGIDQAVEALSTEEARASISAAAVLTGSDMHLGDEVAWVHAFVPFEDVEPTIAPPIIEGRAPADADEIAVGAVTLRELGLSIGDELTLTSVTTGEPFDLAIVGVAVINDNFEASPGRGAVVVPELIERAAPEVETGDPLVLRLDEGVDVEEFSDEIRAAYDGMVVSPVQQAALRNVGRIRQLPGLMAGVVAVLAMASLVHALVLSVGRNRRVLGVLKALGFTRVQVGGTISCHAMVFALVALVVAVPLGIIAGRWLWRLVAEGLGVADVSVVPPLTVAAVCVGALVLANLAAAYPAWRAARLPTAEALRSE